jgi:hypothetical protein
MLAELAKSSAENLTALDHKMGDYAEAKLLFQEALQIWKKCSVHNILMLPNSQESRSPKI